MSENEKDMSEVKEDVSERAAKRVLREEREKKLILIFNVVISIIGVTLLYTAWIDKRLASAIILALLSANIAHKKGRSYRLWYVYGLLLWIFAIVHILILKKEEPDRT